MRGYKCIFYTLFLLFFILFFNSCSNNTSEKLKIQQPISKDYYLELNKDSIRKLIKEIPNSKSKNDILFDISYNFYKKGDTSEFRYWNKQTFNLSRLLNDTLKLAESHWDLGNFFYREEIIDSSFYHYRKAANFYKIKKEEFLYARMLLNIAILQKNIKDYPNSETNTLAALKIIKPLKEHRQMYIGYNNLGILYNQLGEFKNAINFHNRAYLQAQKLNDENLKATTLNNLGVVYENEGDYTKSIEKYLQALKTKDLEIKNTRLYAMLIDNLSYSRLLLGEKENVLEDFNRSLNLRLKIDHEAGIVLNRIHLGEYFLEVGDTTLANKNFLMAKKMAERISIHRDILQSLFFLSKSDKENGIYYLNEYIRIIDSLDKQERATRSKFARIELETDEIILKNELLEDQKKWLLLGFGGAVFILLLLSVIGYQRAKNKELRLERDQQKANEDIYNLLLDQEKKLEEGRRKEKERISRELHDGVLGRLFGIRFILSDLHLKNDSASLKEKERYLDEIRQVEEEIRHISHDLQKDTFSGQINFLKILKDLLNEKVKVSGIEAQIKSDEVIQWDKINNKIKLNIYRIIQESIQNTCKYSQATSFRVNIHLNGNNLVLEIKDNGLGFNVEKNHKGIGLKNISSRVKELKGKFKIQSDKSGTEIFIKIPLY